MNNKKTLLISLLITASAIGLVETGIIEFNKDSIHAQQEFRNLVLELDGEKVTIPTGDWVVAVDALKPDIYIGGELLGVSADGIMIREPKNNLEMNIHANDIGVLYHGEYKVMRKYVRWGLKLGGLTALAGGVIGGISCLSLDSVSPNILGLLAVGFIAGTGFTGIFSVPAGTIIGLIRGKVAEGKAVKYIMGPDDWKIVLE